MYVCVYTVFLFYFLFIRLLSTYAVILLLFFYRNREGYPEGVTSLHFVKNVSEFINNDNYLQILASSSEASISFSFFFFYVRYVRHCLKAIKKCKTLDNN